MCEQRATEARLEAREEAEDPVLGANDGLEQGQKPRGQSPGMRKRQKSEAAVGLGCFWVHGGDHNPGNGVDRLERRPKGPGFEGHKEEERGLPWQSSG